ncbi:hypothetical protein [Deinococcus maricopensis]|uniref:ATP-dependent DNA helicase RecQ n=1 Tax=Deinococcus maricopensis (strain DSM 21211 / LMG 22137 / NRRL B-23946 / LB-34) TaxID=709986 RepID=E8U5E9_DEIML|nr:hypothetical protein [Deinococcus maricopensis]ADV66288.1 ATP-dependent DNA helicase RecQ [Deinococcus maricopensis DSM 21211]
MADDQHVPVTPHLAPDVPDAHESDRMLVDQSDAPDHLPAETPFRPPSGAGLPAPALADLTDMEDRTNED